MPTPRSLRTLLHKISLPPGLNKIVIDHLKEQGSHMSEEEKICFLAWDEVSTESQLYYDASQDRIIGFKDWVMGEQIKLRTMLLSLFCEE